MSTKKASPVDLTKLFTTVTRELKHNQQMLNETDQYNHNHGDNMVKNFEVITQAMRETKGGTPSEQLAHASQVLGQRAQSSSAQLYSQGLSRAAEQLRGHPLVTPENAMLLIQAMMGVNSALNQNQEGGTDLLGSLLGSQATGSQHQADTVMPEGDLLGGLMGAMMSGETQAPSTQQDQTAGGGLLGGLLETVMGGGSSSQGGGIDVNTLLNAGMAFFQARQQGAAPVDALVQAVMSGSQMQGSAHHAQSGQLVTQTLINTLGSMLAGGK